MNKPVAELLLRAFVVAALTSAACSSGNRCYTEDELAAFRQQELPIYAQGFSYLGKTEIVGACAPTLEVEEAYPGIATELEDRAGGPFWATIFIERLVEVSWKSPGAPDPAGMLFVVPLGSEGEELSDYGLEPGPYNDDIFQPRMFLNAFPYDGPAEGAFDAELNCDGGTRLNSENALIVRRWFGETEHFLEIQMGAPIDEVIAEMEEAYAANGGIAPVHLSQENFVFPRSAVVDVVGAVNEVPELPERRECDGPERCALPSCDDEVIEVTCQTQLDALAGCTSLPGDLFIYGPGDEQSATDSVVSLAPLASLTAIGGTLHIEGNVPFTDLSGLENLQTTGSIFLRFRTLSSVNALSGLTDAGALLQIVDAESLVSLSGLENLPLDHTTISLGANPALTDISAIRRPTIFGLMVDNNGFADFSALGDDTAITSVLAAGSFGANPTSLAGLGGVTEIERIELVGSSLVDVSALAGLRRADFFRVHELSIVELPAMPELVSLGELHISSCLELVTAGALGDANTDVQYVVISENPVLTAPPALTGTVTGEVLISGNPALANLDFMRALRSIDAGPFLDGDLRVRGNASLATAEFDSLTIAGTLEFVGNASFPSCRVDEIHEQTGASAVVNESNDAAASCP